MIPFPLPPVLARLHDRLEGYVEGRERGFFLAERTTNDQAQSQPTLIFVSAVELEGSTADVRRPPTWMGEVLLEGAADSALIVRCAKAGVGELWQVHVDDEGVRVDVLSEPAGDGYGHARTFRGSETIASAVFSDLELRPQELLES
jgi:Uma2 family endonuclease